MLNAQIQYVRNQVLQQMYQDTLRSMDYRARLSYETQYACCDAYHLCGQPDYIRCCVLAGGRRYGVQVSA